MARTTRKKKNGLVRKPIGDLEPAAINNKVYRPVSPDDPAIIELAKSIEADGILQPLHVTTDNIILSGHRRHCAARLAGLKTVPTICCGFASWDDRFLALLVKHNQQREKSFDETLREAAIAGADEHVAEISVSVQRLKRAEVYTSGTIIDGGKYKTRSSFSEAKIPFLNAVIDVINEQKEFWPLSVRQIHYQLLNDPPLIHASKPSSRYRNRQNCYKSLTDLCMRARLDGTIPWKAIDDPTRPVTTWNVNRSAADFVKQQTDRFLKSYYRDLLQSQPNHIEIIGEKNTIASIVERVAMEYCIPVTIGRGFCSGPPRKAIADRWRKSGKENLILLVLSDHDPDGCEIAESLDRSFRGDFGVPATKLLPIRAALTPDQITELRLIPSSEQAKKTSSNYKKFSAEYGDNVFELEAVPPKQLQTLLRSEIEDVLDWDSFEREQAKEILDVDKLAKAKAAVFFALQSIDLDGGE